MVGPGNRPPWYVFALAALGVALVLTALVGFVPHSSSAPAPTAEPVRQPYRGPDTPTPTLSLGEPASVTTTTPTTTTRRVTAPVRTKAPTTTTAAPTTTTTRPSPTYSGYPPYCCGGGGWYGGGGGHHW